MNKRVIALVRKTQGLPDDVTDKDIEYQYERTMYGQMLVMNDAVEQLVKSIISAISRAR